MLVKFLFVLVALIFVRCATTKTTTLIMSERSFSYCIERFSKVVEVVKIDTLTSFVEDCGDTVVVYYVEYR